MPDGISINTGTPVNRWNYMSAYAIAVKHGFVGTEQQWLASLKGEQGEKGDDGANLTYKGAYDAETEYSVNDSVTYEGNLYIHYGEESTTGTAPTDTDVWAMIFDASDAAADITAAVSEAQGYATEAGGYVTSASNYAAEASGYATTASGHADAASASAAAASGSAANALGSASAAAGSANDASGYATAAAGSASDAAGSASAAADSATAAGNSAYNAELSVGEAQGYATAASNSANSASGYSSAASEKATEAASYAAASAEYAGDSAGYAEDSQAWATGYRGSNPVSSGDQYHNNAKYWADEAAQSATDAGTAKTGAETARDAAAQWATGGTTGTPGASNNAKYYAEQAEAWATGGSAGTPSATNNAKYYSEQAAGSAASIADSAAQIAANTARIDYVALREEEDRQILFGSIVEAAEDEYDELRSAPIHTAITIGQSVYPRMDNTRLGLTAIKGRTVVDNDVLVAPVVSGWSVTGKNLLDKMCDKESGYYDADGVYHESTAGTFYTVPFIPVKPNTNYITLVPNYLVFHQFYLYDSGKMWISRTSGTSSETAPYYKVITTPANCAYIRFQGASQEIWESTAAENRMMFAEGSTPPPYEPYALTSLTIPTTTLNGVGSAQDWLEVVEDGENDYSLIKHSLTGTRAYESGDESLAGAITDGTNTVYTRSTPTQATIAEHLTLAEVSAIAENGGIIGIVNSDGDIVQPDAVFDTVVSSSAS